MESTNAEEQSVEKRCGHLLLKLCSAIFDKYYPIMNETSSTRNKIEKKSYGRLSLKKSSKNRKVNVVYGDKRLVDCMKNVIMKRIKQ